MTVKGMSERRWGRALDQLLLARRRAQLQGRRLTRSLAVVRQATLESLVLAEMAGERVAKMPGGKTTPTSFRPRRGRMTP